MRYKALEGMQYPVTQQLYKRINKSIDVCKPQLDIEHYRYKRYNIPYCIVVLRTEYTHIFHLLHKYLRATDSVLEIDDTFACIVLGHTDANGGTKYAHNLMAKLEMSCPLMYLHCGVSSIVCNNLLTSSDVLRSAFQNLDLLSRYNKCKSGVKSPMDELDFPII